MPRELDASQGQLNQLKLRSAKLTFQRPSAPLFLLPTMALPLVRIHWSPVYSLHCCVGRFSDCGIAIFAVGFSYLPLSHVVACFDRAVYTRLHLLEIETANRNKSCVSAVLQPFLSPTFYVAFVFCVELRAVPH